MTMIRAALKPLPPVGKCVYCRKPLKRLRMGPSQFRDVCSACGFFVKHLAPAFQQAFESRRLRRHAARDELAAQ
jgi:hypothetical protein